MDFARRFRSTLSAANVLAATACGSKSDVTSPLAYCAAPQSIAFQLTVRDAVTSAPLAAGVAGTVQAGSYSDVLHPLEDGVTMLGGSRTGVYTVTVQHAGYRTYTATNVTVDKKGPCGNVLPAMLTVTLQPIAAS